MGCYEIDSSKGSVLTAFLLSAFSDFFLLGFTFGNSSRVCLPAVHISQLHSCSRL